MFACHKAVSANHSARSITEVIMLDKNNDYVQQRARDLTQRLRAAQLELPEFCTDYFRAIEPQTSPLTRLAYAYDLKLFFYFLETEIPEFADMDADKWTCADLERVTTRHFDMYMDFLDLYMKNVQREDSGEIVSMERENTAPGKMRKLSALRSLYKYLFKQERIKANTAELVDMPKLHEKPIIRLESSEMLKFIEEVDSGEALSDRQKRYHELTRTRDLAMIMLFLGTGIRVSECVGLDMEDLDFTINAMLITRKGGNEVVLYFSDEVAQALKDYLALREQIVPLPGHEQAVFLSLQRRRMGVRAVEQMVKKYSRVAVPLKRRISPHKLRSTFGTNLYRETGDIYLVADVLGHSDVNTTRRHYAAQSDDARRAAARRVKLRSSADKGADDMPMDE
jgi:integrase/recombinase XerC